jgi:hypothetical protein
MKQLDLFTGKVAKYRFVVLFYVSGKGDMKQYVEISENNKGAAIAAAKKQAGISYYEQATAILLPPTEEGSS